jgi:hypothetical protein
MPSAVRKAEIRGSDAILPSCWSGLTLFPYCNYISFHVQRPGGRELLSLAAQGES